MDRRCYHRHIYYNERYEKKQEQLDPQCIYCKFEGNLMENWNICQHDRSKLWSDR